MTQEINFGSEGREKLLNGVNKLSNAVKSTLGAKGKNVIIGTDYGLPIITKDGVTVAKHITLDDYVENMGASLVKEVAKKTADTAGDGTSTSVVLAQVLLKYGIKLVNDGVNQVSLKNGIDKAVKEVVAELKRISKPIEGSKQLIEIASISANNDLEIGKLIAEAVEFVGKDGVITIDEAKTSKTTVNKVDGIKIKQGYITPQFALKTKKGIIEMENPYILLYDKKISMMMDIIPILTQVVASKRPLLIIAEDMDGEALFSLIKNNIDGVIDVCFVKSPGWGKNKFEMMNDFSLVTGGIFVSDDLGMKLSEVNIKNIGTASKVIISEDSTIIIGGNGDKKLIEEKASFLRDIIANPKDEDIDFTKHRLGNLTNGVASISVGGFTDVEVSEKKDRVDDALRATISSLEEGYVSGGGSAYIRCLKALDKLKSDNEDENKGVELVYFAIQEPFITILKNGGIEDITLVANNVGKISNLKYGTGVDINTGELEDMFKKGIIDPTKVARVALENAASIAGTFLTTDCIISNLSDI